MLTAAGVVHWSKGFFNTNGGFEFNLALLAIALAVTATGPGRFSVDRGIGWDDNISGLWWAVGVAVAAALITWVNLNVVRRRERLRTAHA
jgi:putative oxidoreductase